MTMTITNPFFLVGSVRFKTVVLHLHFGFVRNVEFRQKLRNNVQSRNKIYFFHYALICNQQINSGVVKFNALIINCYFIWGTKKCSLLPKTNDYLYCTSNLLSKPFVKVCIRIRLDVSNPLYQKHTARVVWVTNKVQTSSCT